MRLVRTADYRAVRLLMVRKPFDRWDGYGSTDRAEYARPIVNETVPRRAYGSHHQDGGERL